MKISQITIKNFRGIEDYSLTPEELNFFFGPCGSGKTSILKAIGFVLTGEMANEDIRKECDEAFVCLEWEDGTSISRTKTKKTKNGKTEYPVTVKVNNKTATATAAKEFLGIKTQVTNPDIYNAMTNVDYFALADQKELTKLFLSILPVRINFDKLCECIEAIHGTAISQEEKDLLATVFPAMDVFDLDVIDSAYKTIYDARREKNVLLDHLGAKSKFDAALPSETKEELEKALFEIAKSEAEAASYKKNIELYENSLKAKEAAEKRLEELKASVLKYQDVKEPDKAVVEKAKTEKEQFEDAIARHQKLVANLESNLNLLTKTLNSLGTSVCPLSSKLICKTDKSGLQEEFKVEIERNKKSIADENAFIEKCKPQVKMREEAIEKYNNDLRLFNEKIFFEKQIAEFVIPAILDKPADIKLPSTEEKNVINQKLRILAEYENARKAKSDWEVLAKDVAVYDIALLHLAVKRDARKASAKPTLREYVLGMVLKNFEDICNKKAKAYNKDMEVSINADNGIQFLLKTKNSSGFVPMNQLSSGEFMFVIYLITCVIKEVTGAKYLILDNLDKLDADSMKGLFELLKNEGYEHIFAGAVNHNDTTAAVDKNSSISL